MGALYQPPQLTRMQAELASALEGRRVKWGFTPSATIIRRKNYHDQFALANDVEKIKIIVAATIKLFPGVTSVDISSDARCHSVLRPRVIAMFLSRELTKRSFPDLGRRFGGKHHSTVLKVVKRAALKRETDCLLARQIDAVRALLIPEAA